MRLSIIAAPRVGYVRGTLATDTAKLSGLVLDRTANAEAFPGERVVRLPRRFTVVAQRFPLATRLAVDLRGLEALARDLETGAHHVPFDDLVTLARKSHEVAQAFRSIGQRASAEAFDHKRRVLMDDARCSAEQPDPSAGSDMWTPTQLRNVHTGTRQCVACDAPFVIRFTKPAHLAEA